MSDRRAELIAGDCLEVLAQLPEASLDACVTDPPYGLEFMGRTWDTFTAESPRVPPEFGHWLAGFADGEACFSVHSKPQGTLDCQFTIDLRADDLAVLEECQRITGLGTVAVRERGEAGHPQARWSVSSKADCAALAAIFTTYPLRAKKARDFEVWSEALYEWLGHQRGDWSAMRDARERLMALRKFAPVAKLRVGWSQPGGVHQVAPERNSSPASGARVAFHKRRSTYRCSECGRRDGFRNPHDCPGEWLTEFVDAEPLEARAFGAWCELWAREVLRVLKPGAHLLAFGGTRTVHRLGVALEEAGFELRDSLAWGYAQGFPKSHNLTGEFAGRGTALKPAWEPILMARKLPAGTVLESVTRYGTGALNIAATMLPISDEDAAAIAKGGGYLRDGYVAPEGVALKGRLDGSLEDRGEADSSAGRWPANVVLTDEVLGADSRFFLIPKASREEREPIMRSKAAAERENTHPTVKPLDLMRHLVRLVTPPGGTVLDPFLGSGTTALAAELEGFGWVGIERDPEYVAIAEARLKGWQRGLGLDVPVPSPTRSAKPPATPAAPARPPEPGLFD